MKNMLVVTVVIGLASVAATVIVGSSLFEGTVVKDPYTTALHWDSSHHDTVNSGLKMTFLSKKFTSPKSELIISFRDREGKVLTPAMVEADLTLPSTDRYDSEYALERTPTGAYRCVVKLPVKGRWLLQLKVKWDGKSILFDDTLTAE